MNITENNPFMQKPELVIFDLCGTLLNSKDLDHEAINYTLRKFGKEPWNITRSKKNPLESMKNNFPNFFGNDAQKAYETYLTYLIENINLTSFFSDSLRFLRILKSQKIKTAVITNRDKSFVQALDRHNEFKSIKSCIDLIIIADDLGTTKPSTKVVDYTLENLNMKDCRKNQIILIGDALADMRTAIDYSCIPVLLTASMADITDCFLSENKEKIYTATSYQEIITCLLNAQKINYSKNISSIKQNVLRKNSYTK